MRKEFKKIDGQRDLFTAKYVREGTKNAFKGSALPTILFKEVRRVSDKKLMCDHIWLNKTKALAALDLSLGLEIQFVARVKKYSKGYQGRRPEVRKENKQDFKLSHPTQVKIVRALKTKSKNAQLSNKSSFILRKAKE